MLQHLLFLRPSIEGVSVTTENLVFKLIYAISCPIFLAFGVIFYTRICFTDPINCICNSTESFKVLKAIDSYCLENSYVVQPYESLQDAKAIQIDAVQHSTDRIYQSNYQYVGILFVICGAICYLPYVLWEWFENGLLKSLLQDLMSPIPLEEGKQRKQIQNMKHYLQHNAKALNTYAIANIFCEALNLFCLFLIGLICNEFLDGHFLTFGITSEEGNQAVLDAFPKLANCSLQTVGPGGEEINYQGICTMNLNHLSEKMFYTAWWWLSLCITVCIGNLTYRSATYRNLDLRTVFKYESKLNSIELSYGEYFTMKRIQQNVPISTFAAILNEVPESSKGLRED